MTLAWRSLQAIPRTLAHDRGQHNEAWTVMHGQFHAALVSACGLQWLMRFRNTLYEQSERYRRMAVAIKSTGRDIDAEHRAIVEAVLAGDAERATARNGAAHRAHHGGDRRGAPVGRSGARYLVDFYLARLCARGPEPYSLV